MVCDEKCGIALLRSGTSHFVRTNCGRFSAFLIFIPVFALAFFVFCFLCCVVCLSRDYEEDEGTLVLSHEQFQQGGTLALSREQVEQTLVRTGDMSEYNGHPTAEQLQRLIDELQLKCLPSSA